MNVLCIGEEPPPGSGAYLLAILRTLRARTVHVPSGHSVPLRLARRRTDLILLSDAQRRHVPDAVQAALAAQVWRGAGLCMIGGWGSFSGPFGRWRGSRLERCLPVACRSRDDRTSFPAGALLIRERPHPMLRGVSFADPPAICGLNDVRLRPGSRVLLSARPLRLRGGRVRLTGRRYPLLVLSGDPRARIAAFTSDAAPHWCGGLVDWGGRHRRLAAGRGASVEVGEQYVRFFAGLFRWLAP